MAIFGDPWLHLGGGIDICVQWLFCMAFKQSRSIIFISNRKSTYNNINYVLYIRTTKPEVANQIFLWRHFYLHPSHSRVLSAGAHSFLRSCNTVAFLQEEKCIFVGWIFTFTHVWRTNKNPLIYRIPHPILLQHAAVKCSMIRYGFLSYCKNVKCELIHSNTYVIIFL